MTITQIETEVPAFAELIEQIRQSDVPTRAPGYGRLLLLHTAESFENTLRVPGGLLLAQPTGNTRFKVLVFFVSNANDCVLGYEGKRAG